MQLDGIVLFAVQVLLILQVKRNLKFLIISLQERKYTFAEDIVQNKFQLHVPFVLNGRSLHWH